MSTWTLLILRRFVMRIKSMRSPSGEAKQRLVSSAVRPSSIFQTRLWTKNEMSLVSSPSSFFRPPRISNPDSSISPRNCRFLPQLPPKTFPPAFLSSTPARKNHPQFPSLTSRICADHTPITLDRPLLSIAEAGSEAELWAAACLRVRSFYEFPDQTYGVEDHKRYLAEREFEALKDRIAGKRIGFNKVSCINATLPLSRTIRSSKDLCSACKFSCNGEDRVVVGSLDINQCRRLADEITGMRPEGIGADFARAYISNVCVATELHRNGVGYALVAKSKKIAWEWGITDLYAHVADDNEPAKNLYAKSGFIYENEEPAWQARFLGRPRRLLLWADLTTTADL
ncbi:GCN5-related N-acetyltransferase 7, chloroplastic [Asimina triloba]